jgi:hypothetical protein
MKYQEWQKKTNRFVAMTGYGGKIQRTSSLLQGSA